MLVALSRLYSYEIRGNRFIGKKCDVRVNTWWLSQQGHYHYRHMASTIPKASVQIMVVRLRPMEL